MLFNRPNFHRTCAGLARVICLSNLWFVSRTNTRRNRYELSAISSVNFSNLYAFFQRAFLLGILARYRKYLAQLLEINLRFRSALLSTLLFLAVLALIELCGFLCRGFLSSFLLLPSFDHGIQFAFDQYRPIKGLNALDFITNSIRCGFVSHVSFFGQKARHRRSMFASKVSGKSLRYWTSSKPRLHNFLNLRQRLLRLSQTRGLTAM